MSPLKFIENAPVVETYLARLDRELKSLPAEERDAARRELRQHVDGLIAAHRELGMTEADATRAALRQFGDARKIGGGLRHEWRLSHSLKKGREVTVATLLAIAMNLVTWRCAILVYLIVPLPAFNFAFGIACCFFVSAMTGAMAETQAPGRGLRAVLLAFVVDVLFMVCLLVNRHIGPLGAASVLVPLMLPLSGCFPIGALAVGMTGFMRRRKRRELAENA